MDAGSASFIVLLILIAFLASGTTIFISILCVCVVSLAIFLDFDLHRIGVTMSRIMIRASSSWELSAIPLFLWMGEIVYKSSLIDQLFRGLIPFLRHLPGGLLHTNVVGSAMFAAVSGSSAATTATIGKIMLGELDKRGYDKRLAVGSLAGAGTLGLLIPPSIIMIIYGLLAEVSIIKLFAAGIFPGLLIALLYSAYISVCSAVDKNLAPIAEADGATLLSGIWDLGPIFALIVLVLGTIYSGYATPSESAAIGVAGALFLITIRGELSFSLIKESLYGAVSTACMICTLLAAAGFLSTTMGFLHIPQDVATFIGSLDLSPLGLIFVLSLFYMLLGLLLDGISITVMTLPITLPLILAAGIDPLWFGIFLVIMVELGQMTPPVGFNLFIIHGMSGIDILTIAKSAFPFFLLMCLAAILITFLPNIALWLPSELYS
ncbi:TRAP transporter large permease [Sneathiella litorea]|uniref:TRAP transporter large permease protein n=1 Tax=Sneathiella litorea TaxID=2606216 RepID=A0A6L8W911_9PROT|nr:TRAP transporter large permease subunit [Sneathiella litorea]MZR30727.1 TRAP transporter large permease subunit [Sneathiella litorea]